ncbi:MAG: M1 family metallopeptidase, partial [bacterium]
MFRKKLFCAGFLLGSLFLFTQLMMAQEIPVLFPEPLSPRIANYNIDVRLDTEKRMLDGQEVLIWYNKTADTIKELQFHMYLNAFRNNKSTFMEESGGMSRGNKIDKDGWGFSEVDHITLAYGKDLKSSIQYVYPNDAPEVMGHPADLTDRIEFIRPDNENENDKTVFRLPLPKPLPPGEFVAVNIDFTAKLPQPPFARTGAKKEYFFAGQWFPKIGVYIDGQWNTHQFHSNSEFFADYGVYNVRMTVPEENIVGATGIEVDVKKNDDGTATHFYHAEDVHDFAWTTSPEFVEFKDKAQDVDIRVLMQPDHAYQGQRHLEAAKVAIEHFQDWYGDYPFPNLTVVDPRRGAGGSGGMEYPTLITAGTVYGLPEGIRGVEMVIIHEFGHNYWYHLLASNEFEESWMDEGINTYTENQIIEDAYGAVGNGIDFLGIKINDLQFQRAQYINGADLDPMIRRSWEYYSGGSYSINSYSKPGLVLTTLQNYLGDEVMQKIMRAYVERWRFKHPKTQDFIDVVNDVSGQALNWFFDQAFFSRAEIDYSVAVVLVPLTMFGT